MSGKKSGPKKSMNARAMKRAKGGATGSKEWIHPRTATPADSKQLNAGLNAGLN